VSSGFQNILFHIFLSHIRFSMNFTRFSSFGYLSESFFLNSTGARRSGTWAHRRACWRINRGSARQQTTTRRPSARCGARRRGGDGGWTPAKKHPNTAGLAMDSRHEVVREVRKFNIPANEGKWWLMRHSSGRLALLPRSFVRAMKHMLHNKTNCKTVWGHYTVFKRWTKSH
jgi:hypothetical protein